MNLNPTEFDKEKFLIMKIYLLKRQPSLRFFKIVDIIKGEF